MNGRSLDFANVPARERGEVLAAFAAHTKEVTAGYVKRDDPAGALQPMGSV